MKEPYKPFFAKEPYVSAKEHFISTNEPCNSAKEAYLS